MKTIGQKRVWRCHRCQNIAGPTTSFTSPDAKGELGTDWQKFYSFSEYKLHCQMIHDEMLEQKFRRGSVSGHGALNSGGMMPRKYQMESDNCFGGGWG